MTGRGGDVATIGVAIAVPDPWGEQLQELRASFGDPLAWTIPTHVTLLPPTQVQRHRLDEVDDHLRRVASAGRAFSLTLSGTATFRPVTQTSFVVVATGADDCGALAERVRSGPVRRSLPFPYHPHVTIAVDLDDEAHDRAERELAGFVLAFEVVEIERFELAEHGVWESVAFFPLGSDHG